MQVLTVDYHSTTAAKLFCQSLKETGFAVLVNHPIPKELIIKTYQEWQFFFASERKFNYLFNKQTQDGYFPFRSENAKDQKVSDLKEFYHFYLWGQQPPETKNLSSLIYQSLNTLAEELLSWIENELPAAVSAKLSTPLNHMIENSRNTLLRILHYPPLPPKIDEGAVRAAPHEDINLITLLPAATAPGLEVLDINKQWHPVSCDQGSIVVNVGDMLQMCTDHHYVSTTHRVFNPSTTENHSRFSMPLFLHPRDDVKLSPELTAIEYKYQRLREIGLY